MVFYDIIIFMSILAFTLKVPLNFLYGEDLFLVGFFMEGELASLSEALFAAMVSALEWFLPRVDVSMFFQVLSESEPLEADHTHELFAFLVSNQVSSEGKPSGELLAAGIVLANIGFDSG